MLVGQGFRLHKPCSPDGSISWAEFSRGGSGVVQTAIFSTIYWKEDRAGRLVWTTGNVSFSGF